MTTLSFIRISKQIAVGSNVLSSWPFNILIISSRMKLWMWESVNVRTNTDLEFSSVYAGRQPPAKVRSSISTLGTGKFVGIEEDGSFLYEFENGELYEF